LHSHDHDGSGVIPTKGKGWRRGDTHSTQVALEIDVEDGIPQQLNGGAKVQVETSRKFRLQQSTGSDLSHQNLQFLDADKSISICSGACWPKNKQASSKRN